MNLQSKFGYCMTAQTLNIAHNVHVIGTKLCTDKFTNKQTDGQSKHQMTHADLSGQGHKKK